LFGCNSKTGNATMKKSLDDPQKKTNNTLKNNVTSQLSSSQVMVLLSGGLDSLACLNYYLDRNYSTVALFVDYNQASKKQEFKAVKKICDHYKIPLTTVDIKGIKKTENGYIQGRNAFLLYTALLKFNLLKGIISIGIHASSHYWQRATFRQFILD
jgi:tRNA(Ile)-lysidine synthase TilS/MesJ